MVVAEGRLFRIAEVDDQNSIWRGNRLVNKLRPPLFAERSSQ